MAEAATTSERFYNAASASQYCWLIHGRCPGDITTRTFGALQGIRVADLTWSGANGTNVDYFRGSTKFSTANDGFHTDDTGQRWRRFYYVPRLRNQFDYCLFEFCDGHMVA